MKFLVVVRNGAYQCGEYGSLDESGVQQMRRTAGYVRNFLAGVCLHGDSVLRLRFSFSGFKRATESIGLLEKRGDLIITDLPASERGAIMTPRFIFGKICGLAEFYSADVVYVVAHGEMPSVLAEAAANAAEGRRRTIELPGLVDEGCGYIVNASVGQVWSILPHGIVPAPLSRAVA